MLIGTTVLTKLRVFIHCMFRRGHKLEVLTWTSGDITRVEWFCISCEER